MSEFQWSDAWLLLAVKYAVDEGGFASRESVMNAGDMINHAHFMPKELDHGHKVLEAAKLLHRTEEGYQLGTSFKQFWLDSGAEKHRTVHKQLEKVADALGAQ